MDQRTQLNDARIRDALDAGRLRSNPLTGQVWLDGELAVDRLHGYVKVHLDGHILGAHRVVWIAANGSIPAGYWINHRNGARADNRLSNLETVTPRQNNMHGRDAWWPQPFIRGEDLVEVRENRPDWLARVVAAAEDPSTTSADVSALRAEIRPEITMRVLSSRSLARRAGH